MPLTGLEPLDSSWQPARAFVINDRRLQANRVDHRPLAGCSLHNLGSGQQVAAGARRRGGAAPLGVLPGFPVVGGRLCDQPQAHPLASEVTHLRVAFLLSRRVPAPRPPSPPPHSRGAVVAGMTNSSKTQLWQMRRGSSLTITRISWTRLPSRRTRKVARASREQRCSSLRNLPRA